MKTYINGNKLLLKFEDGMKFINIPPIEDFGLLYSIIIKIKEYIKENEHNKNFYISNLLIQKLNLPLEFIGSGSYGSVYGYKNYAIKYLFNQNSKDPENLEKLQGSEFFPKLYFYESGKYMISERIIGSVVSNTDKIHHTFADILKNAIRFVGSKKLTPDDVSSYNIVVRENDGKPVIVDVGNFNDTDKYSEDMYDTTFENMVNNFSGQIIYDNGECY